MDEETEEEVRGGVTREVGPPLLTPLSEDAIVDAIIPWTATQSTRVQPDQAVALIRSNIWPGAVAFAFGRCVCTMPVFNNDFPLGRRICDIYVTEEYKFLLGYRRNSHCRNGFIVGRFDRGKRNYGALKEN